MDQRLVFHIARIVDQKLGREIIHAINHDIILTDNLSGVLRRQPFLIGVDLHIGV